MEDYDKLISTPYDLTGTVKAAATRTVLPDVHAQEQELGSYKPRRAKITKNIIGKLDRRRGARSAEPSPEETAEWRQWRTRQHAESGSRT